MLLEVADASQVSAARRAAAALAKSRGFDETKTGRVALIATELATNLIKHAQRGEIVIGSYADSSGTGLELVALDKGEGIADLGRVLADGTSTAGSPGTGLGAIRRQADQFNIFSRPTRGTAMAARISDDANRPGADGNVVLGAFVLPYPGEAVCGDAWAFGASAKGPSLLVADGSGHGGLAQAASQAAVRVFEEHLDEEGPALMADIHRALAPTRGAAVAVARVDRDARLVRYVGIGNIVGAVISAEGQVRRMVSHNGTAGHIAARIAEFTYPCPTGALVVLHSDGLSAKWDFGAYPGLTSCHPSLVAGVLFRDFRRSNDDASVVAMRV